ncbi:portal protein [Metabacillus sp. cB07]|uniref:portal protein n=1 Tax=Metabacillus sp. cB07 TaxID=2806989 RepID=UPI00193A28EA|nr:portal protein [Metabacillus sp. cB07]
MSKKTYNMLEQADFVEKQYKEGLAYKKEMGFFTKWSEHERFKAGDQWPAVTEKTKNLPRPVLNIIKQVINHKVASVMTENIKMVFSASDTEEGSNEYEGAELFTRYSETTWEKVKQDQLNEVALESGATTGPCIWHYYWDTSKSGGNRLKYVGEIQGEIIDAVNFFPGNPQCTNIQDQPFINITSRDLVSNVRKIAESNGLSKEFISLIKADSDTEDQAYDFAKKEMTEDSKVTVITKYWKENGTVYFQKVASGVVVKPKTNMRFKLYPIALMQWERRKSTIFGISEVEGIIPNQKAINYLLAMQLLSIQLTSWPKLLVDKSFVKQQITNTPGEVINVTGTNGSLNNAIAYMNPGQTSNQAANLLDSFLNYTRDVAGANENALGEQSSSQLNATAVMLLQQASGVPLESIKRRFYQAMEDVGLIWSEFWRVYYNTDRVVNLKDEDGEEYTDVFNGEQYKDVDMNLKIDIGPSSSYSETLMMTSLDKLFDTDKITIEDYLQFAPKNVIPFKDRLLKKVQERQEQEQMMMAQEQEQQSMMQQQQQDEQIAQQSLEQQQAMEQEEANAPHPFDQFLSTLPKHKQDNFRKLSPEEQEQIMQQTMTSIN